MLFLIVISAGIVAFLLGAVWYTVLFGKLWIKEVGMTEEEIKSKNGSLVPMIVTLIIDIALSFFNYICKQSKFNTPNQYGYRGWIYCSIIINKKLFV